MLLYLSVACPYTYAAEKIAALKGGMITDVGGINDQSFNQSTWEGMQKTKKELGMVISYQESKQDADYAQNLETMLDNRNDIIFGIGFKLGDAVLSAAKRNPGQKYALIDISFENMPSNMLGVIFRSEEAAFLTGYIAGIMTKTGKVGFIGGINVPVVQAFQYGFRAGEVHAIPGLGALLVEKIEGDYLNVVGLPLASIAKALKQFGISLLS